MVVQNKIQLSRGFSTTPSSKKMSAIEVGIKSTFALTLGFAPFVSSLASMKVFKAMANLGAKTNHTVTRDVYGLVGVPAGATMIVAAKVFGLTQELVWRDYVRHPTGDALNTRLAWYGVREIPRDDIYTIAKAFFTPQKIENDEWSLKDWSQIQV